MTNKDDLAEFVLDDTKSNNNTPAANNINELASNQDIAEFLIEDGSNSTSQKPNPKSTFTTKSNSGLKNSTYTKKIPKPTSPSLPLPPPQPAPYPTATKTSVWSFFWPILIIIFSIGIGLYNKDKSKVIIKKNTGIEFSKIDSFNRIKAGKKILSKKFLVRTDDMMNVYDWSDSIIILAKLSGNIHQYYINIGSKYKSYESYQYANGFWNGYGNYGLKKAKIPKFLDITNDFYKSNRKKKSFITVKQNFLYYNIEVRGCDIKFDENDDIIQVQYVYNSISDPLVFSYRIGYIYSTAFAKKIKKNDIIKQKKQVKKKRRKKKLKNDRVKIDNTILTSNYKTFETNNSNLSLGDKFKGGIVFSLNKNSNGGLIVDYSGNYKCKWNDISNIIDTKNNKDKNATCCIWRLPSIEELTLLFKQIPKSNPNFADGIYWSSSEKKEMIEQENITGWWIAQKKLCFDRAENKIIESKKFNSRYLVLVREFSN
jgi:hypothetical protein